MPEARSASAAPQDAAAGRVPYRRVDGCSRQRRIERGDVDEGGEFDAGGLEQGPAAGGKQNEAIYRGQHVVGAHDLGDPAGSAGFQPVDGAAIEDAIGHCHFGGLLCCLESARVDTAEIDRVGRQPVRHGEPAQFAPVGAFVPDRDGADALIVRGKRRPGRGGEHGAPFSAGAVRTDLQGTPALLDVGELEGEHEARNDKRRYGPHLPRQQDEQAEDEKVAHRPEESAGAAEDGEELLERFWQRDGEEFPWAEGDSI
jgi:hypothetical protein